MNRARVSVLVPTYNRAHFLAESLKNILSQTCPPSQLIVINDGSTDNTCKILEPFRNRTEYLEKENGGKPTALNLGLSRVTGDYVWIMDDDDVAFPDALERHLAALERHPELGFTYGGYCLGSTRADGRLQPGLEVIYPDVAEEELFLRLLEANFIPNPAWVVRTACYKRVGPYNPELIRSEDHEMLLRLARHFRGTRIPGPVFWQRQHGGRRGTAFDSFSAERIQAKHREYQKKFIPNFCQELKLEDYVPRLASGLGAQGFDKRRAHLQRMTIWAAMGLYQEMLDDMRSALADPSAQQPWSLSPAEQAMVGRVISYLQEDGRRFCQWSFLRKFRTLTRSPVGQAIRDEYVLALRCRGYSAWRKKDYPNCLRAYAAVFYLRSFAANARVLLFRLRQIWAYLFRPTSMPPTNP